ncbi:MAG: DUF6112 family protein [Acidimicrobiales bacterium]
MSTVLAIVSGCFVESGTLSLNPNSQGLPGSGTLQDLVNGLGFWGLLAALAGLVIGAATWALGAHTNNYQNASTGRRAVLVSAAAALVIGAAPTLLNFLFNAGQSLH